MAPKTERTTAELDAFLVRNLADLERASHRVFHVIEERVCKDVNELVEDWALSRSWEGEFDFFEKELWFGPGEWKSKDGWLGRFYLDGGLLADGSRDRINLGREEDLFLLSRLCQTGRGKIGFRWWPGDGLGLTRSKLQRFLQGDRGRALAIAICKKGLVWEDRGTFFLETKVDVDQLADAISTATIGEALAPLQKALKVIASAKPAFDKMLAAVRRR